MTPIEGSLYGSDRAAGSAQPRSFPLKPVINLPKLVRALAVLAKSLNGKDADGAAYLVALVGIVGAVIVCALYLAFLRYMR